MQQRNPYGHKETGWDSYQINQTYQRRKEKEMKHARFIFFLSAFMLTVAAGSVLAAEKAQWKENVGAHLTIWDDVKKQLAGSLSQFDKFQEAAATPGNYLIAER